MILPVLDPEIEFEVVEVIEGAELIEPLFDIDTVAEKLRDLVGL